MGNRRNPKPVKNIPETVDTIADRMDRLYDRIERVSLADNTRSHVQSLIMAAKHILISDGEIPEDEPDQDDDDDDEPPSRSPRSLRREWAGPLPNTVPMSPSSPPVRKRKSPSYSELETQYGNVASRYASTDVSKMRDNVNGLTGPDPNRFETTYDIAPESLCSQCRGAAGDHPIDRNLPAQKSAEGVLRAHIMCDSTRAYMPIQENE
jgi:hypothetical protein